jgi:GAF domain-containing protein
MKADAAVLYLRDGGGLRVAAMSPEAAATSTLAASLAARVLASGEPDSLSSGHEAGDGKGVYSLAAAPLVRAGDVAGALVVVSRDLPTYEQQDTALLVTLAGQVAVAVRNADMHARLERSYLATVAALAGAIETKDDHAPEHPRLIAEMCEAVGLRLELSDADLRLLHYGAIRPPRTSPR